MNDLIPGAVVGVLFCAFVCMTVFGLYAFQRALRLERRIAASMEAPAPLMALASSSGKQAPPRDPGKQALQMLQRGEDCDWHSIERTGEMHEAFDCLEIYWRTKVRKEREWGQTFEERAGFRVRWRVAAACTSYVEAYGLDLMSTILEARELADRQIARVELVVAMDHKHPALEAWKERGDKRRYSFHGLDLEKWFVSLEYPGGHAWADHEDLEQAVADALSKGPT